MDRAKQNTWRVMQGLPELRPMEDIVEKFQGYMSTYHEQPGYQEYTDETFIEDILYGMGVSIDPKYQFANGLRDFKKVLLKHLKKSEEEDDDQTS